MKSEPTARIGTTAWCLDLPCTRQRPLEAVERERLTREATHLRRNVWRLWCGFTASFVLFLCVAIPSNPQANVEQGILTVAIIVLISVGLPVAMLLSRDWVRRGRLLRADLCRDVVKCYGEQADSCTVEVLAASRYLWRVDGGPAPGWKVVEEVELADAPPFAALAAKWLQPLGDDPTSGVSRGERDMSGQEAEELRRSARRLWLRPLPLAVGLTAWAALPLTALVLTGPFHGVWEWVQVCGLFASAATSDFLVIQGLLLARVFRADCRNGRIVIVRYETPPEQDAVTSPDDEAEPLMGQPGPVTLEVLPVSGRVWTEEGRPAAWRRLP